MRAVRATQRKLARANSSRYALSLSEIFAARLALLFEVAAELEAHRGKNLVREVTFAA